MQKAPAIGKSFYVINDLMTQFLNTDTIFTIKSDYSSFGGAGPGGVTGGSATAAAAASSAFFTASSST